MALLVFIMMVAGVIDCLVEAKKGPIKASRRGNKPAGAEQKKIEYKRQHEPKFRKPVQLIEDAKIHSMSWDVKTREIEEVKYVEV